MSYALGIETLEARRARVEGATEAPRDLARTLYTAGQDAFDAGSYTVALRYFTDAWSQVPHPAVLLAIGSSLMRLGRFQDAAYRFQRYLRETPTGPERERAQTSLAEAQAALEQQATERRQTPPPRPPEVPVAKIERVSKTPAQIAASAPAPRRNVYSRGPSVATMIALGALGLAGVGVVVWSVTRRR